MTLEFNLAREPWIVASGLTGHARLVSVQAALLDSPRLFRLEDESPLVLAALHRFLLAVLHRALGGPISPREAAKWLSCGKFPEEAVKGYLHRWEHKFDLFSEEAPFFQVPGFCLPKDKQSPVSRLAPHRATGNNKVLFDHSVDAWPDAAAPDLAARWLIGCQGTTLGGGKSSFGYLAHAPAATSAIVLATGRSLFETLCLNLLPYGGEEANADAPVWERQPLLTRDLASGLSGFPRGVADRYTWQSRSILLHPEHMDGRIAVRRLSYAAGIRPGAEVDLAPLWRDDPMVAYRKDEKLGKLPVPLREDRSFWRDFGALAPPVQSNSLQAPRVLDNAFAVLRTAGRREESLRVAVFGQVTDKAKVSAWRAEEYPLPRGLFDESSPRVRLALEVSLRLAEQLGDGLRQTGFTLASQLLSGDGSRPPDPAAARTLAQSFPLARFYWSVLDSRFAETLARLGAEEGGVDEVLDWWRRVLRATARAAMAATVRSLGGRAEELRAINHAEGKLAHHIGAVCGVQGQRDEPREE